MNSFAMLFNVRGCLWHISARLKSQQCLILIIMSIMRIYSYCLFILLFFTLSPTRAEAQENAFPHLQKNHGCWELMVDGQPYLMLAGELHNSSTGSAHYMAPIWKRMATKHLNTVIAAVSWELIEPTEGHFDFTLVDEMIRGARESHLRLVILWFGSWKNGGRTTSTSVRHLEIRCAPYRPALPDIYSTDLFDWVMERYDTADNPVMVPETKSSSDGAARAFYAFGRYQTLCYSPFGIDGAGLMNSADPSDHAYDKTYQLLGRFTPLIIQSRRERRISGLLLDNNRVEDHVKMGRYVVAIRPSSTWQAQALVGVKGEEVKMTGTNVAGLLVMQEDEGQFLVAGGIGNMIVNVYSSESGKHVAFESVDELTFDKDGKEMIHRLNGDETTLGGPVIRDGEVKAFRIKMYEY